MAVITSVARVLRCFETHQELSVTRLMEELALPKSTVSRLMQDMAKVGFLEQDKATRRYRPGPLLMAGARQHRASVDLAEMASVELDQLVGRFGHTGFVMVLDGPNAVTLKAKLGTRAIRVHTSDHLIGGPAYLRSPGRALLARLSDDEVRRLYPDPLQATSETAPRSIDDLTGRLDVIRRQGFAEANGDAIPGVGGLAVAVGSDHDDAVALNITFAAELVRAPERREIAAALIESGISLGARINDPFWRDFAARTRKPPRRKAG
jgi:DNA-binding IclR family transcriptional regulator